MILGSRGSRLALAQTAWVRDRLMAAHPGLVIDVQVIRTTGDLQEAASPEAPARAKGSISIKGIFVKEIEEALLEGRIQAAVHSLKDLPVEQPDGLVVSAVPAREDPRDVLVTRDGAGWSDLRAGARVGTGSLRRVAQLRASRPDIVFEAVRGNVETRIRKMMEGLFDAVVLAAAGLLRLGLLAASGSRPAGGARILHLPEDLCLPAVGQGALAIETRAADRATRDLVVSLQDPATAAEVAAERAFLAALGGGCRTPVAALARAHPQGGSLTMQGVVADPEGSPIIRVSGQGIVEEAERLGARLASVAMKRGAAAILREGDA